MKWIDTFGNLITMPGIPILKIKEKGSKEINQKTYKIKKTLKIWITLQNGH